MWPTAEGRTRTPAAALLVDVFGAALARIEQQQRREFDADVTDDP